MLLLSLCSETMILCKSDYVYMSQHIFENLLLILRNIDWDIMNENDLELVHYILLKFVLSDF